jgi:hypothetical protein
VKKSLRFQQGHFIPIHNPTSFKTIPTANSETCCTLTVLWSCSGAFRSGIDISTSFASLLLDCIDLLVQFEGRNTSHHAFPADSFDK